jgi:hypothetical protein
MPLFANVDFADVFVALILITGAFVLVPALCVLVATALVYVLAWPRVRKKG